MSLNVAARALTTNQSVLQVIGHNISNANTVGYSRQSVSLDSVAGQKLGNGYFGKGVEITSVKRSYDAFLTKQANSTATLAAGDELRYQKMQQVEALFPLGEGSLGTQLNNALNAWVDVQASPADSTARQVVINRADEFAARIRDTSARLAEIDESARLQSVEVVKAINQLALQFADLNKKVVTGLAAGQPPNDLLDQRDQLLTELNEKINISAISAGDGSITLFVANSYPLVMGATAGSIKITEDETDRSRQALSFVQGSSTAQIGNEFLLGGEIKGLQDFINQDLTQANAYMGRMALGLAVSVNNQLAGGLKPNGDSGTALFKYVDTFATSGAMGFIYSGSPSGTLTISVSDVARLEAESYEITIDPTLGDPVVKRLSDGSTVAASPPLTALESVGLILSDGVALASGQKFVIGPAVDAAKSFAVALTSPKDLAVASSLAVAPDAANTGTTVFEGASIALVSGVVNHPVSAFSLEFDETGSAFTVTPSAGVTPATVPYVPGKSMSFEYDDGVNVMSYSFAFRGQPADGDEFNLQDLGAVVDPLAIKFNAGNAHAILTLRDKTLFDGVTSLSDGYVPVFASVASTLRDAKFSAEFSTSQAAIAETQRANKAGVNLDEEAAMLVQYQQAYQASAKYMGTVQSIFDTLMSAFR